MNTSSRKFWMLFVAGSVVFLAAWYVFWEVRAGRIDFLQPLLRLAPVEETLKTDFDTVLALAQSVLDTGGEERVYLLLFQNNMELRPGGGFIGSFGILKVRDGHVTHFSVHDSGIFDGRVPQTVPAPYPMEETLRITSLQLRDSNYYPDFPENARQAVRFYELGQGGETFDGVVGITTNVLTSFLEVTGPVTIEGFPGTYGSENAILDLEYQVEKAYVDQNISFAERKSVMNLLGNRVLERVKELPLSQKYELFRVALEDLHRKDIVLSFADPKLQKAVKEAGWDGALDTEWDRDYLMVVDANLGAYKSDYYMKRSFDYQVDFRAEKPRATLTITYQHTAPKRDWFTKDYVHYVRVYGPADSYLTRAVGATRDPRYGEYLGKKVFGVTGYTPVNSERTITFEYDLPATINDTDYDLKIQKQIGLGEVPVRVTVLKKDGTTVEREFVMDRDAVLSEIGR